MSFIYVTLYFLTTTLGNELIPFVELYFYDKITNFSDLRTEEAQNEILTRV